MSPATFDEIYTIMEASFPVSEMRTYSGQRALLDNPITGFIPNRMLPAGSPPF